MTFRRRRQPCRSAQRLLILGDVPYYLGSKSLAEQQDVLQYLRITRVINCAGGKATNTFEKARSRAARLVPCLALPCSATLCWPCFGAPVLSQRTACA